MSRHEDVVRLRHMLDHAREAVSLIEGRGRDELDSDRLLGLGLVRLVFRGASAAKFQSIRTLGKGTRRGRSRLGGERL
jgi:hypothetical protein